jgi:lipopolysaccharide/colanic/teichoic acid biosynthesis glycosyltransferase
MPIIDRLSLRLNPSRDGNRSDEVSFREQALIPAWKRALDIALIMLVSPLLAPLMLFIAVLIRTVSPGPVFFKQERVGGYGRRFLCLKFRTMFLGADAAVHQSHLSRLMSSDEPMEKMDGQGDPRVIPLGVLLRASGLDELPQILNVLRGEMSLVGPRPCLPYEYERYLPWQKERFNTAPGLTGLWQVRGKNRTTFVEMVQWDIRYVRTRSLWLDTWIILTTLPALVVQMQDIRKRRKSLFFPAQSKAGISTQAVNQ